MNWIKNLGTIILQMNQTAKQLDYTAFFVSGNRKMYLCLNHIFIGKKSKVPYILYKIIECSDM